LIDVLKAEQYKGISLLWNTSAFELILICRSNTYETVVQMVRNLRVKANNIVREGSTLITLKAKDEDTEMTKEHIAITYLKLNDIKTELKIPNLNKILWFEKYTNPVERLGWFDCCFAIKFKSLKTLHKTITELRKLNQEKIRLSSTMFLWRDESWFNKQKRAT
jgi:hypothetical protein